MSDGLPPERLPTEGRSVSLKGRSVSPDKAPSRGGYDRRLTVTERRQHAQRRLRFWTARGYLERGADLGVEEIVKNAGMGRSSFYEYYEDVAAALIDVARRAEALLREQLLQVIEQGRTPTARVNLLTRHWFAELAGDRARASVLLHRVAPSSKEELPPIAKLFQHLLLTALHTEGEPRFTKEQLLFVTLAVGGLSERVIRHSASPESYARLSQLAIVRLLR